VQALEAVKLCLIGPNTIIQYLAENGGKINAANKTGLTSFDLASGKGGAPGAVGLPKDQTMALIKQLGGTPGKEVKKVAKAE